MHYNVVTRLEYQGGNQMTLAIDGARFTTKEWGTFLQWKQVGYVVKKGQKAGGHVVKFVDVDRKTKQKDGSIKVEGGKAPRGYAVFNRDQVEALPVNK